MYLTLNLYPSISLRAEDQKYEVCSIYTKYIHFKCVQLPNTLILPVRLSNITITRHADIGQIGTHIYMYNFGNVIRCDDAILKRIMNQTHHNMYHVITLNV